MQLAYNSKFKPQNNKLIYKIKRNANKIATVVGFFIVLVFIIIRFGSSGSYSNKAHKYPKYHGFSEQDLPTKSPLIFPSIEHAPLLREMSVDNLFKTVTDLSGNKRYVYEDMVEDENSRLNNKLAELGDETNQLLNVRKHFLKHGKQVFKGSKSPEVVIVTGVDFEKFELSHLTKIVQNRVNYAQKKNYGVYVRWIQEFLPLIQDVPTDTKWIKLYLLRSAMYAFPDAKYFWYIDEQSLIMRYDIDLFKYLLDPKALDPIMLRDQPIIPPNGIIHTFKNSEAKNIELILTQVDQDLNLDSFIIKNTFLMKTLLEFLADKLFRNYHSFSKFTESALTHVLQWHPIYLSRTTIIPPRTIASLHTALELPEGGDDIHYSPGDFVVTLRDCEQRGSCGKEIESYWSKLEGTQ